MLCIHAAMYKEYLMRWLFFISALMYAYANITSPSGFVTMSDTVSCESSDCGSLNPGDQTDLKAQWMD